MFKPLLRETMLQGDFPPDVCPNIQVGDVALVQPKTSQKNSLTVLVADDHPINQKVIQTMLEEMGCHVLLASNGKEAFDCVLTNALDLVMMDIQMPEMNGIECAQKIRSLQTNKDPQKALVPIIAVTANAMAGEQERCLAAGMNDHLPKPIDPEALEGIDPKMDHPSPQSPCLIILSGDFRNLILRRESNLLAAVNGEWFELGPAPNSRSLRWF